MHLTFLHVHERGLHLFFYLFQKKIACAIIMEFSLSGREFTKLKLNVDIFKRLFMNTKLNDCIIIFSVKGGKNLVCMNFSKQNREQRKLENRNEKQKEKKEGADQGLGHDHGQSLNQDRHLIQDQGLGHSQGHTPDHPDRDHIHIHHHHHQEPGEEDPDQGSICLFYRSINIGNNILIN